MKITEKDSSGVLMFGVMGATGTSAFARKLLKMEKFEEDDDAFPTNVSDGTESVSDGLDD